MILESPKTTSALILASHAKSNNVSIVINLTILFVSLPMPSLKDNFHFKGNMSQPLDPTNTQISLGCLVKISSG
jgi:hypothetical protein